MLEKDEILKIFEESGALQKGHFKLVSGLHSPKYFQSALVFQHPKFVIKLCSKIAERFKNDKIDGIIGVQENGSIMAYEVAKQIKAKVIFTEKKDTGWILKRGFNIREGERILIVDDITTTGGTIKNMMNIINENKGVVGEIALIASKGLTASDFPYRTEILVQLEGMDLYKPEECPRCQRGQPLDN